jgi:poly(A) polymerase
MPTDDRPLAHAAWLQAAATRRLLAALAGGGAPVRFVGGCVRDTLIDPSLDMVDLDLATPLPPERSIELLTAAGIRTIPTGIAHGTITALVDGRAFEITTLRQDVATDGRRAVVAFTDCFFADAARRDFTINAMSCDAEGRLYDPFDGRADLDAGRIRFVGEPRARIAEDYLRILRFFRFFARFGRERPPATTLEALAEERQGLQRLSGERLRAELLKLLRGPNVEASLQLMAETEVWQAIFLAKPTLERFARLRRLAPDADPILELAALTRGVVDAPAIAERLRLANDERDRLVDLATAALPMLDTAPVPLRALAYRLGRRRLADRLSLAAAERAAAPAQLGAALALLDAFGEPQLPVRGRDLVALGIPHGPAVGTVLRQLEAAWIESDFTADRESLLALVQPAAATLGDNG